MISKQHAKLRYEQGYWDELDPFYDFKTDDAQFAVGKTKDDGERKVGDVDMAVAAEDGDEDGWEDVAEDEEVYDGYEREIAKFGLDVTPLGEIIFPDGRIIGHRALKRYYKQNIRPVNNTRAVVAARRAAGERLHDGQVVSFSGAGAMPTKQLKGVGKGILVGLKDGVEGFSAVSLYRYRAAVRKQRRNDVQGQRLQYRSTLNMNRMDKKANRLMNGVSVAHALR
jgi:pre-60S factor REI1